MLLVGELFQVEHPPWEWGNIGTNGERVEVAFQPTPTAKIIASFNKAQNKPKGSKDKSKEGPEEQFHITFGLH